MTPSAALLALMIVLPSIWLLFAVTGWFPWEPLLLVFYLGVYLIWRFERKGAKELGLRRDSGWKALLLLSVALSAGYVLLWTILPAAFGVLAVTAEPQLTPLGLLGALLLALLVGVVFTALPEELAYRGVLLRTLSEVRGVKVAILASGLLFAWAHLAILSTRATDSPESYLAVRLLTLTIFGCVLAWATVRTGSLWLAIGWHAGGNLVGIGLDSLLVREIHGPGWFVGYAAVGPHGDGVLAILAMLGEAGLIAGLVCVYMVYRSRWVA